MLLVLPPLLLLLASLLTGVETGSIAKNWVTAGDALTVLLLWMVDSKEEVAF